MVLESVIVSFFYKWLSSLKFFSVARNKIFFSSETVELDIKAKINKCDLIKIKNFCTTKETISKVKRHPSEWEKITALISINGLRDSRMREWIKGNSTK